MRVEDSVDIFDLPNDHGLIFPFIGIRKSTCKFNFCTQRCITCTVAARGYSERGRTRRCVLCSYAVARLRDVDRYFEGSSLWSTIKIELLGNISDFRNLVSVYCYHDDDSSDSIEKYLTEEWCCHNRQDRLR